MEYATVQPSAAVFAAFTDIQSFPDVHYESKL